LAMADTYDLSEQQVGHRQPPSQVMAPAVEERRWELVLAGLGLLLLYLPTYFDLARGPWTDPHEAHGPFVLAIAIGVAVARWREFAAVRGSAPAAGLTAILFGAVVYAFARSQEFLVFETMSQIPVIAGLILVLKGWQGLRVLWFPVSFLCFTIVWPGWAIDALTLPLKRAATDFTVHTLFNFGYPISSTGVVIMVGRYQLLVADACSGLTSIFSLLSVGALYLYLMRRPALWWNLAIIVAMPFIAFAANVLRILALTLITYHFGDAAGQSFLHDFFGLFLFGVALALVFLLDMGIERAVEWVRGVKAKGHG
jgi:exosortase B